MDSHRLCTVYTNVVEYPEYRNIGPSYHSNTDSTCSNAETVYIEAPDTEPVYMEPPNMQPPNMQPPNIEPPNVQPPNEESQPKCNHSNSGLAQHGTAQH